MAKHQHRDAHKIFELHQESVLLFEAGKLEAARAGFSSAFSAVNRLLRDVRRRDINFYYHGSPFARESCLSPTYSSPSARFVCPIDENNKLFQQGDSAVQTTSLLGSSCAELPLFAHPLHLPDASVTVNQFVFVTLYNLALSTHLSAFSETTSSPSKKKQETLIQRAEKQWQLAYSLQWRKGLNLVPLHALAILLNLAHAQFLAGNNSSSKICYENILSIVHILDSRSRTVPNRAFFLYNAFRMLGKGAVTTASAA